MGTVITGESFTDHFDYFDDRLWQRGYWWQTNDQPFHPLEPREWFDPWCVRVEGSLLKLDLKYHPRTFTLNNQSLTIQDAAGVVCSRLLYNYGCFEARIRLSAWTTWDAFWLFGDTGDPSEIDIMEQLDGSLAHYHTNVHITFPWWCLWQKRRQWPRKYYQHLGRDFHVYGLRWYPDRLEWYFDGMKIRTHRSKARYITRPQRIILNTARRGAKDSTMEVDWVRYEAWQEIRI